MHNAFECVPILERMPLPIDSVGTVDNNLLVGTNKGHLLVYEVREKDKYDSRFEPELQRSNKAFSRKPITQMTIVKELELLISLSDGLISVHDLQSFSLKCQLHKFKGASFFATDLKKRDNDQDLGPPFQLRLCFIVKRKLMLYYWINGEFQELYPDLGLAETPKVIAWYGDYICYGGKRDYYLIKADSGNLKDLFPVGSQHEPYIRTLKSGELALNQDKMTVFLSAGKGSSAENRHSVTWSDDPLDIEYISPYIIAIFPKSIEIWSRDPKVFIQKIDLPGSKLKSIVQHQDCYVYSQNHVWRLVPVPINRQIQQLTDDKQFEVALSLIKMMDGSDKDKERTTHEIENLYAFDLMFRKKKFEEALYLFTKIDTDPLLVIGVFPNLLPEPYRKNVTYPYPLPDFSDGALEKGLHHLTGYLAKIRKKNMADMETTVDEKLSAKKMLAQVVDTSLLKCYLHTNEGMIAPLLRVGNNCHVEECERVLKKAKKYNELVLLYQNKGIHKKALDLLLRLADRQGGVGKGNEKAGKLKGHEKVVEYLQKLGPDHMDLILDYSAGILKKEPEDGLKIFTEDMPEIESLPRENVLQHLNTHAPQLVMQYLEHVITDWKETKPEFHNRLIVGYTEKIVPLYLEFKDAQQKGSAASFVKAGKEPGDLGALRTKLIFFLETSTNYQPLKLLRNFPTDCLFEERAILFGRAGRHEEAFAIYIYVLKDKQMAEQFCRKQYEFDKEENRDVYLSLLKMYLKPTEVPTLRLQNSILEGVEMKPDIDAAIEIMNANHHKIDVTQALELLPAATQITAIRSFLNNILEDKMAQRRKSQVYKSLLYSEHLQVHEQRVFYQSKKCTVTDERACRVCHKKIGTSAFATHCCFSARPPVCLI
ncbi:vam6/Vps39-like protein isoform X2 [Rhopilema esculentum]|uniref:vam6/Vps39-like protein isoform X2 n=1 Tax=Rhopilema esculentum TaxID=499914 RepID=UPI0031D55F2E